MKHDTIATASKTERYLLIKILSAFPISCFTCALLTDIVYIQTMQIMWADFSEWLLAVGMLGGVMAAIAGLGNLVFNRRREPSRLLWPLVIGSLLILTVAFINNLVHSRDGWTSVMPTGLLLSSVTVLLILITVVMAAKFDGSRNRATSYGEIR